MSRRGTILLSVLIVVVIASLVGASAMYSASAQSATATLTLRRAQLRAIAWSGVQAAMAELAAQREAMLDGETPELTAAWELFADSSGRGVVRLLPVASGDEVLRSEAACLNVNTASAEMLHAAGVPEAAAKQVADAAKTSPFESVESILALPDMAFKADDASPAMKERDGGEPAPDLASLLTVWSFDPNVQHGVSDSSSRHRGNLRINLDLGWSDRLEKAIEDRFGEGSGAILKRLMDEGATFKSMADVVSALERLQVEPRSWAEILDALTITNDPYLPGKVDLLRAPAEVLACLPGIDLAAAQKIVERRASLEGPLKHSVTWPLLEGILTREQFRQAIDCLTTRSYQWKIRIEAGVVPAIESGGSAETARPRDRLVLEAVIDVASERPRVAYLRDVTMEAAAESIRNELIASGTWGESDPESEASSPEPGSDAPGVRGAPKPAADAGTPDFSPGGGVSGDLTPLDPALARLERSELERWLEGAEENEPDPGVDRRLGRWRTGKGSAP
jgi:DNA uptake protein ComE-like DNA-binding protein